MASRPRFHHIDALRGSVMLLIVPYHSLKYIQDTGGGIPGLSAMLYWLHLWRMPLFFAVSGFLAAMTLARWGMSSQLRLRMRRIGIPLAVAFVTVLPLINLVMITAAHLRSGPVPPRFALTAENLLSAQPMHLWFLIYLLAMTLISVAAVLLARHFPQIGRGIDRAFRRIVGSPLAMPSLALAAAAMLWAGGYWRAPGKVAHSVLPDPWSLAYYSVFFFFGWLLYRNLDLINRIEARPVLRLIAGTAVAAGGFYLYNHPAVVGNHELARTLVLGLSGVAATLILFGIWGVFARVFSAERAWLRYLADSAYWIYLIHVPFLLAFSIPLAETGLPAVLRLLVAVTAALAASLATYAIFVRHTAIGSTLHGPRPGAAPTQTSLRGGEAPAPN